MKTTLPINLHFNNRRMNLLIYCYIMGKMDPPDLSRTKTMDSTAIPTACGRIGRLRDRTI